MAEGTFMLTDAWYWNGCVSGCDSRRHLHVHRQFCLLEPLNWLCVSGRGGSNSRECLQDVWLPCHIVFWKPLWVSCTRFTYWMPCVLFSFLRYLHVFIKGVVGRCTPFMELDSISIHSVIFISLILLSQWEFSHGTEIPGIVGESVYGDHAGVLMFMGMWWLNW